METVALYGGSFDPPHIGHIRVIEALKELPYVDKIIIMPTYLNPFKKEFHAPPQLRLNWLKKIFLSDRDIIISSFEINLQREVATIETVKHLKKRYKNIFVVIGADNLKSLHKWNSYNELKELVHFMVAKRGDIKISDEFIKLNIDEDISSKSLRKKMDISKVPAPIAKEIEKYYKEQNAKQNKKYNRFTR